MARRRISGGAQGGGEAPAGTAEERTAGLFQREDDLQRSLGLRATGTGIDAELVKCKHAEIDSQGVGHVTCACSFRANEDVWKQWKWRCQSCQRVVQAVDFSKVPKEAVPGNSATAPACEMCGKKLLITAVGAVYQCGHDTRQSYKDQIPSPETAAISATSEKPKNSPPPTTEKTSSDRDGSSMIRRGGPQPMTPVASSDAHSRAVQNATHAAPNFVVVTWGEEKYSPKQFHTYSVGPFTDCTEVREGETRADARARLYKELVKFAESVRDAKRDSFLAAIRT